MTSFIVSDCVRCGVKNIQQMLIAEAFRFNATYDLAVSCNDCIQISVYRCKMVIAVTPSAIKGRINIDPYCSECVPVMMGVPNTVVDQAIPQRVANLFIEAAACKDMQRYEAAGAIFRKTLDVATKHIFASDPRLSGKQPAQALRVRVQALGTFGIIDNDIAELADVAALDGNDAAHDEDPYTAEEAEALEDLTRDLLDRLFVRPAKIAAVKAKQIAAGVRKA